MDFVHKFRKKLSKKICNIYIEKSSDNMWDRGKLDYLVSLSEMKNTEIRELFKVAKVIRKIDDLQKYISLKSKEHEIVEIISDLYLSYDDEIVKHYWNLIQRYSDDYCLKLYNGKEKNDIKCNVDIINKYMTNDNDDKIIFVIIDGLSYVEWYDFLKSEYKSTKDSIKNWIEEKNDIDISILDKINITTKHAYTTLPSATILAHRKIFNNINNENKDNIIITNRYCKIVPHLVNARNIQNDSKESKDILQENEILASMDLTMEILSKESKHAGVIWLSVDGKLDDKDENEFKPGGHYKGPKGVKERIRTYITSILKFLCKNNNSRVIIFSDHGMHANINSYTRDGNLEKLKSFDIDKYLKVNGVDANSYKIERYASRGIFINVLEIDEKLINCINKLRSANVIKLIIDYSNNCIIDNILDKNKFLLIPYAGYAFNNYNYVGDHGGIEFDEFIIPEIILEVK